MVLGVLPGELVARTNGKRRSWVRLSGEQIALKTSSTAGEISCDLSGYTD